MCLLLVPQIGAESNCLASWRLQGRLCASFARLHHSLAPAQARALPSVPNWDCYYNQKHSFLGQALLRTPVHATVACFVTAQTYAVILGLWGTKICRHGG